MPWAWSSLIITQKEFYYSLEPDLVICLIPVLLSNRLATTGDPTIDKLYTLPSLDVFPGGIKLEVNINPRRGGDLDYPLHPPLLGLHLQTLTKEAESKRSKLSHKKRRRRYMSSSLSDNQSHDYGRYKRSRYSPQAAQNLSMLQPAEITNVQLIPQPQHTLQCSTKDSGSDSEIETWSFDRAVNEVFRLLPLELCPRPTEEHAPAMPSSGIEHLTESHSDSLLLLPQSKLVENTARFLQSKTDTEKCGRDWLCSQNLVSSLTQTKFYKRRSQYFHTDNILQLESEASLLDLSRKGKCSISMKNIELWEKEPSNL